MAISAKHRHFRFLAFMLMISTFLPLIFANLPPFIRSHHIWTIAWFFSITLFNLKIFRNQQMVLVILYGILVILLLINTVYINVDDWNKNQLLREFYEIAVAISVIAYFRMEGDYVGLANLMKWTIIFIFITSIMSVVTAIQNPTYARDIVGVTEAVSESQRDQILSYKKYGGGGYSFASALVCMFPILIYYYKNSSESYFKKPTLIAFIIILMAALLSMQIFANILISLVFILLSFFGSKNAKRGFIIIGFISVIILFFPLESYVQLFKSIATLFNPNSEIYFKFNDFAQFLATGASYDETAIGGRAARYPMLWESFLANPLLGHFNSDIVYIDISKGVHLFWMNKLAVFGLVGTIPFVVIIYKNIRVNLQYFDKGYIFYYLLSIFAIIVLGAMKTVLGRELWYTFFILLPGFYYLPLLKKKYKYLSQPVRKTSENLPSENPQ